jgi:RNA polymerase sigma-70 factor (ECF subfamily)
VEGRPLDDTALVERAQQGDVVAYEELMQRYQAIAFRVAFVVAGDPTEAEDAVQEGFVRAWYGLPRFRPGSPFRPWLLRIVANQARNRRRSAGRRANLALRSGGRHASGDATPSPEEAAIAHDRRRRLLEAVNSLPERDRLVIAYRYFEDLSEAEAAVALGCAPGTVKSRLSRALGRLRERIGDE